ncbi:MAG: flagellar biosynthesis protein FlhA [Pseudomonadota bacterium]
MTEVSVVKPTLAQQVNRYLDVFFALGVVGIVLILLLPMPKMLLDLLLSLSITASVVILMTTLFIHRPLDLSSFPTILLIVAVLRLSLNIASTRLILANGHTGPHAAGKVVQAFGGFVMQGSVVIGIIIFAILTIINFVVITKGSGRIAEVAARFSLDAMPGKQMAIDADLSAGLINEAEAKQRRKDLENESTFFASMDGANKFVRGDAVAGLLITFINFIGGIIIGIVQRDLNFSQALETYTILTIGDGLVSQIPALVISLSAGIIVSKSGVVGSAEKAVFGQLGNHPQALMITGGVMTAMATLPGLPTMPFLSLGGGVFAIAWMRRKQNEKEQEQADESVQDAAEAAKDADPIASAMKIEMIQIDLGYGILPLLNYDKGNQLTEQIKSLRQQLVRDLGFVLPSVKIQDNVVLGNNEYSILIKDIECGGGEVRPDKLMVMNPSGEKVDMVGEEAVEPAFGLPAMWIDQSLRDDAMVKGYTVVDPPTVVMTHLSEIVKEHIGELMTYSDTQKLFADLDPDYQKLFSDLVPSQLSVSAIQQILQLLLEENVSIRDLPTILTAVAEGLGQTKNSQRLTEYVRAKLARQISHRNLGQDNHLPVVMLSPAWEQSFNETLTTQDDEVALTMPPSRLQEFVTAANKELDRIGATGEVPIVLTSPPIRRHVYQVLKHYRQMVTVMSQAEVHPKVKVKSVGQIS